MKFVRVKSWITHNKLNSILVLLSLALLIYLKLSNTYLMYLDGLENKFSVRPLFFIPLIPFLVLYAISSPFLLVYYMTNKSKSLSWKKDSFSALPILILFLIIPSMMIGKPGVHYFLRGYEKWVEKEVDVSVIREWLISLPENNSGKRYTRIEDYPQKLPEEIMNLKPQYMYLSDFNEGRYVEFEWGGGFSHWGIRIGTVDMEIPEESESERIRLIQSGVYMFERG